MPKNQKTHGNSVSRTIRKYFVSGFVILSFAAYALHQRVGTVESAGATTARIGGGASGTTGQAATPTNAPVVLAPTQGAAPAQPTTPPTATPVPPTATTAPRVAGQYKDGQYTGTQANAFWGTVQVKAVVQNGKLADVQILNYPADRRTSQRINTIALPELQQEALQAQNANIDFISGATLTSQAFMQSLQTALSSAKS